MSGIADQDIGHRPGETALAALDRLAAMRRAR